MNTVYAVSYGKEAVGKVQLQKQGLYYRVIFRCRLRDSGIFRLYAAWNGGKENLGVVLPEGDGYVLDRKIPVNRFMEDGLHFYVSSEGGYRRERDEGVFCPISPEEPFLYIDRLKTAFLQSENGKIGIRTEQISDGI